MMACLSIMTNDARVGQTAVGGSKRTEEKERRREKKRKRTVVCRHGHPTTADPSPAFSIFSPLHCNQLSLSVSLCSFCSTHTHRHTYPNDRNEERGGGEGNGCVRRQRRRPLTGKNASAIVSNTIITLGCLSNPSQVANGSAASFLFLLLRCCLSVQQPHLPLAHPSYPGRCCWTLVLVTLEKMVVKKKNVPKSLSAVLIELLFRTYFLAVIDFF